MPIPEKTEITISIQRSIHDVFVHISAPAPSMHFRKRYLSLEQVSKEFEQMRLDCDIKSQMPDLFNGKKQTDACRHMTSATIDPGKFAYTVGH
jgi:hypothetical protein